MTGLYPTIPAIGLAMANSFLKRAAANLERARAAGLLGRSRGARRRPKI